MTEHNPAEWFKLGKVQQFEGNHQEAVISFEQSLIGEWRVEIVVKELYNSLVKLRRFEQALTILDRYQDKITQKEWLGRERLNIYKKLGATEKVSDIYCDLLRKTSDFKTAQELINELTLYYYRQELYDAYDLFIESFSMDEVLRKWLSVLHIKWILHVFKDLKVALKSHFKINGTSASEKMKLEVFYVCLESYAERTEFKYLVTDHLTKQVNGLINHYNNEINQDARGLLLKYMSIPCYEWSIEAIIKLGQRFMKERSTRIELQQYAQMLLKQEDMVLLNILVSGLPDLYDLDEDPSAKESNFIQEDLGASGTQVNQWPEDDLPPLDLPDELTLHIPKWSNSEMQYLDAFIERLGHSIDLGLRYVKQFVVAPISSYALSYDETTDTLWRMRRHYEKNVTKDGWIWFKHLIDLLLKDLTNVGLWMEVPYVVMQMAQSKVVLPVSKSVLAQAGNNAWLYALYGIDKKFDDFTVPVKELYQESYNRLTHQDMWQEFVHYHHVMGALGFDLSLWDQLYGMWKSVIYVEKIMNDSAVDDSQGPRVQRVISETHYAMIDTKTLESIEALLFVLSQDLKTLKGSSESHRYMRFFKVVFGNALQNVNQQQDLVFSARAKKLLDFYLELCGPDKINVCVALLKDHQFDQPKEQLATYLATICTVKYFERSEPQQTGLNSGLQQSLFEMVTQLLLTEQDQGLKRAFLMLKDGLLVGDMKVEVDTNGLLLLNHVLTAMVKGESLDEQLLLEAKVALLESVELDGGLALFEVLYHLDPTSLGIHFHLIDFLLCNRQYDEAYLKLQSWLTKYNGINEPSEFDRQLFETCLYQFTWLQDTTTAYHDQTIWQNQIDLLPDPMFYLELHQLIKPLIKFLKRDQLDFLRDVFIHWDSELYGEVLRLQGDSLLLRMPDVIRLCQFIFSADYFANILKMHEGHPSHIYLAAYCDFEAKNNPERYRFFQIIKTNYRSVYGPYERWLVFSHGKVAFQDKKWHDDLNDSIVHQRRDQFKWLCALIAFVKGSSYASVQIAKCLEDLRLPKWEQDGFWRMAYDLISIGPLAHHIGEDALKQGRYKDGYHFYRHLNFADLGLLMNDEIKFKKNPEAKNQIRRYYFAYLAYKLSNAGVERGEKPLESRLTQAQWRVFHKSLYEWLWHSDTSVSLREAYRLLLMKSKQSDYIVLWYAGEQRHIGNLQLADKLERL